MHTITHLIDTPSSDSVEQKPLSSANNGSFTLNI